MMKIWDYFYLTIVRFQLKVLKKDPDDVRMSVSLITSLWLGWLIVIIILALGLFKRNWLADAIVDNILFFALPMGAALLVSLLRYYHFVNYADLEKWRAGMSALKRRIMYISFLVLLIGIPILFFITFRSYNFRYILE